MESTDDKKETVKIVAVCPNEEGRIKVKNTGVNTNKVETIKYIEKKLADKGLQRMERHPADGLGGISRPPPKSGHGGKYTWEGPDDMTENELKAAPPAIDEKDPNYVDEEEEEKILRGEDGDVAGLVVGVVEVAKEARKGVARVELHNQTTVLLKSKKGFVYGWMTAKDLRE